MSEPIDPILAAAEARRDELAQDLQKVRDFISSYHAFARIAKLDSVNTTGTLEVASTGSDNSVDPVDNEAAREAEGIDEPPPKRVRVSDNPKPADVVAAAVEVIRTANRPLTRREIHVSLADRGIVVRGADPIKALGTMLWRSGKDRLTQVEGYGYWIKDVPVPTLFDSQYSTDLRALA